MESQNRVHNRSKETSAFTREEELLMADFSQVVSQQTMMIFYFNAFVVSLIPMWFFWRIRQVDTLPMIVLFSLVSAGCVYGLAFAYKNTRFSLKYKISQKIVPSIKAAVSSELKKKEVSAEEKSERILWKKNEISDKQATTFCLFYTNALFLALCAISALLVFRSASPAFGYILSSASSAGLVALFSTTKIKK